MLCSYIYRSLVAVGRTDYTKTREARKKALGQEASKLFQRKDDKPKIARVGGDDKSPL